MLQKIWITFCLTWIVLRVVGSFDTDAGKKAYLGHNSPQVSYHLPVENS